MINITTWAQLDAIRNNLTADYQLMNNLSSSSTGYIGIGDSFVPIGYYEEVEGEEIDTPFDGTFNGNGHTISDLIIEQETNKVGLFGVTGENSSISNIGLINVNISGNNNVGGLVGSNCSTISDSYTTGTVSGNSHVGGLVGNHIDNANSNIYNSYTTGTVSGNTYVGGLVGNCTSNVYNSYSTGTVSGNSHVGGFAGYTSEGERLNCGWFYNPGYASVAIGNTIPIELISYNIKNGGGTGYIDDTVDWFYDKTRDIYDTTSPVWDFTTPIWYEHATDYPNFESERRTTSPLPMFFRS
jgi:hypothetical protein